MNHYYKEAFEDGYRLGIKQSKSKWIMRGMWIGFGISTVLYIFTIIFYT